MYTDIHQVYINLRQGDPKMCQGSIYHYDGYCFNKNRVPEGKIAIRVEECLRMNTEKKHADIIRN